jgi:hypothetical protein
MMKMMFGRGRRAWAKAEEEAAQVERNCRRFKTIPSSWTALHSIKALFPPLVPAAGSANLSVIRTGISMHRFPLLVGLACSAATVLAQSPLDTLRELAVAKASKLPVKEIRLRADPEPRVRPLETVVVQALVYGENEAGELVRIQSESIRFRVEGEGAGRISKPYRYPGEEQEKFYQPEKSGLFGSVFRAGAVTYALQDSALYAAPEKEGTYKVVASADGVEASIEIEVTSKAESRIPAETTTFGDENTVGEPYRELAEHYAPFIAQETWFEPKYDYLARFDLDGDWRGDNNWEDAPQGSSQAYVYYTVMETATHWFAIYNFFHPRDYSDKCVIGTCHENDNEGLILTIQKDGSRFGKLRAMETLAHNNVYSNVLGDDIRPRAHNIDGAIGLHDSSRPQIFIEAGGHGVLGASNEHSLFDAEKGEFTSGSGLTYLYKGKAEQPKHPNDRNVGYELLPMWEHWWLRSIDGPTHAEGMFDAYYSYRPVGRRPVPRQAEIAGSFLGRAQSENKAKPFWGWHDNKTRKAGLLATGQWALDPAYSAQVDLEFPEPFSVDYTYNPYLGIGTAGRSAAVTTAVSNSPPPPVDGISAPSIGGAAFAGDGIAAPAVGAGARAASGTLDYEAVIDGEAILSIRGDRVEVVTGSPGDPKASFSRPMPAAELGRLAVTARDGRAEALAEPSAANGYAAIVRARPDGRRGKVRFRLEWAE